jgi:hypothetical protein
MRQGQQNRRGRGRGRRTQNPLTRNFESNGPDVKIRGTAAHIAEKYSALARDALSSGDPITAENYLQHAEHYNRIIMAAQHPAQAAANAPQPAETLNGAGAGAQPQPRPAASPPDAGTEKVAMTAVTADDTSGRADASDGNTGSDGDALLERGDGKADGAGAAHAKSDGGKRRRRRSSTNGETKSSETAGKAETKSAKPNKNGAETPSAEGTPPDGAVV